MTEAEIAVLEARLDAMSDEELRRAAKEAELESKAADIVAGECERRGIDL